MTTKVQNVTVFTGDLVNSTQLTKAQLAAAFDVLETCAKMAAEWHGASLQFTRHRGDGWQVILAQPKYALRTALYFRASLKALGSEFDTYIGIARGEAAIAIKEDLNSRNEDVFVNSGRALELIKKAKSAEVRIAYLNGGAESAATILADKIVDDWTPTQAETMAHILQAFTETTYTEIAKALGKSRQTVTRTLTAAGFEPVFLALELLEQHR